MQTPTLTAPEAQARSTFLTLMEALGHPGRICELEMAVGRLSHNLLAIGNTLLDLETSFYTSNPELSEALAQTSARNETPSNAEYHFYPVLTPALLEPLKKARVGTMVFPEQAATIVIGCRFHCGPTFIFRGPGIETEETIHINGLPLDFWAVREEKIRYPLGWDIFLVHDHQVIGIPRTTEIQIKK